MNFCQKLFIIGFPYYFWIHILAVAGLPAIVHLPAFVSLLTVDGFPTFITVTALSDVPKAVRILAVILLLLLKSLMLLASFRVWFPTLASILTVSRD
jgi:hypothetical protein